MAENIRVRIAPSPTGKLHIGTARTALFNYLFAKKNEGTFVVRMEDTDKERSSEDLARDILDGMLWLGIIWDEGPEVGGPFEPYYQQERLHLYEEYTQKLLDEKKAYRCYCTPEELTAEREAQQARKEAPKYSGKCRHLSETEIDQFEREGRTFVVRFIVDQESVEFDDLVRGHVSFDGSLFGDFTVVRSDGTPLFLLSNAIDDNLMKISHVLRGEDHLSNTAKQILLCQALGFLPPQFGHFPLILNANRSKMSKRKDPVSIQDDYKAKGYLAEAIVNFIALLGWSPGTDKEIFTMHELIEEFQIERVGKSPSIFDPEKLLWMNGYYIRQLAVGDIASKAQTFIRDKEIFDATLKNPDYFLQVVALVQDRMKTLADIEGLIGFFYRLPDYTGKLLIAKKSSKARTGVALKAAEEALTKLPAMTTDETELALREAAKREDLKDGEILWAVRVALTGVEASPGVFELLEVIGKKESLERIATARKKLANSKG